MSRLGLPLLILSHHVDLILSVPVQGLEQDVVTARREPDLWFPVGGELLGETGRKDTRPQEALDENTGKNSQQEKLRGVNNYRCKIIQIKNNDRTWCLFFTSLKNSKDYIGLEVNPMCLQIQTVAGASVAWGQLFNVPSPQGIQGL